MIVATMRIGLPDFDQSVIDGQTGAIEDSPLDTNALANSFRGDQDVAAGVFAQEGGREKWANGLRTG
jgi:hypothetical protein